MTINFQMHSENHAFEMHTFLSRKETKEIKPYLPIINEVIEIVDMPNAVRKRAAVNVT